MILSPTYRNATAVRFEDRCGKIMLDLADAVCSTGRWRYKHQGDGLSMYSTSPTKAFTYNSGKGYKGSGETWAAVATSSISNARAYYVLEELDSSGTPTGRQFLFQRRDNTASTSETGVIVSFSWDGFTGTANATTAPATTSQAYTQGTINTSSSFTMLDGMTTSTAYNISGLNTVTYHIWIPDGEDDDVSPFALSIMDLTTTNDFGRFMIYEALDKSAAADPHPCIFEFTSTAAMFAEVYNVGAQDFSGSPSARTIDPTGAVVTAGWSYLGLPSLQTTNTGDIDGVFAPDADGKYPIFPAICFLDTSPLPIFKGVAKSLKHHVAVSAAYVYPNTAFADTAHPTEDPLVLYSKMALPWEVGVNPAAFGAASADRTDLYTLFPALPEPDSVAPVIGAFSPGAGAIAYSQAITVSASDAGSDVAMVSVSVSYSDPVRHDLAYSGDGTGSYEGDYDAGSSVSGASDNLSLVTLRDGGWLGPFTLQVRAVDSAGNSSTASASYTISTTPNPAAPDTTAPTISNITPPPGSAIADDEVIEFDVTDVGALAYVAVYARYLDTRDFDVVYDGTDFAPKYSGSTIEAITDGYHFVVTRDVARIGGWATSGRVRFTAVAMDTAANVEAA